MLLTLVLPLFFYPVIYQGVKWCIISSICSFVQSEQKIALTWPVVLTVPPG